MRVTPHKLSGTPAMKQILIIITLLAMVTGAFLISLISPSNVIKQPIIVDQERVNKDGNKDGNKSAKKHTDRPNTVQITAETPQHSKMDMPNIAIQNTENTQLNTQTISDNPAAQFNNLPQEMQEEIKILSGRYNKNIHPIEVEPGVFMLPPNKAIRVVPVAVMNKDGTVSTYEY